MSEGFPDRLTQLRARWQGDPSSRVFLQLAEEYRHLGRVRDALIVLETGLKEHPGYLSALVAKGRCLLELGDADQARGVLERVVQQDATQMVANKLLVRAYLETNEPERARQRLDLYSLLNDSDPEIEDLRRRVVAMSRSPRAPDGPRSEEPAERPRMDPSETPEAEVFDLGPAEPARSFAADEDIFGLGTLPDSLPAAPPPPPVAEALAEVAASAARAAPTPAQGAHPPLSAAAALPALPALLAVAPRGEGDGTEPFPDPAPAASRRLYLTSLEAEQIFSFGRSLDEAREEVAAPETQAAPTPMAVVAAEPQAAPIPVAGIALAPAAPPTAAEPAEPLPPSPLPAAAPAPATVTLGELYLRQGHLDEAKRIFDEVVEREPGNAAAREALARLEPRAGGRPLDAGQLLAGLNDPQAPPTVRKAYLLQSYLARLRQPRRPHVP
jgi:tetratricopeptide (TPR) repeat protein